MRQWEERKGERKREGINFKIKEKKEGRRKDRRKIREKNRGERKKEIKKYLCVNRHFCVFMVRLILKLTRGLAPQYQDLTRCVSPPSKWDLQPPKPPPPPPSELLSSLPSSSSSSISRSLSVPPPRLPLPIISASLPSQPPSLSCVATPGEKHRKPRVSPIVRQNVIL